MSGETRYERGDLAATGAGAYFAVERAEGEGQEFEVLGMTADELRWLCVVAGPALLAEHDPAPTPAQATAARIRERSAG